MDTSQPIMAEDVASGAGAVSVSPPDNYRISQPPERPQLSTKVLGELTPSTTLSPPEVPRIDTNRVVKPLASSTTQEPRHPWGDLESWDAGGEIYRQNIEALRDKVGNGYLNVLDEENWDTSRPAFMSADFGPASPIRPNPTTRMPSTQAIHSGGALV
jgi:hypothetical protein